MSSSQQTRKLGPLNYLAYGAGDIYGGGAYFILSTFTMFYLINVVGMSPLLAGLIPAIGKIWDALMDPVMGYISDRTPPNRFGKRRVWFVFMVAPIAITFTLLWLPIPLPTMTGKFIYYVFAYILFFTVSTISFIPYTALSAEMTFDSKERNNLAGSRIFFSYFATILVALVAKPIIDYYQGGRQGYLVMGLVFSLIFALPWITLVLGTWELPASAPEKKQTNIFRNFFSVFKNKSGRYHILIYMFSYGAMDILMAWFLFFVIDFLHKGDLFVPLQGTLIVTMMLALPVYVYISTKKGHIVSYIIGLSLFLAGMGFMSFQEAESSFAGLLAIVVLIGAGLSAAALIPKQLLPFVVDLDRLISGRERAGTYASAMALSRKLFHAIIIMNGLGILLSLIDYRRPVPTVLPPDQFQHALTLTTKNEQMQKAIQNGYQKQSDGNFHLRIKSENSLSEKKIARLSAYFSEIEFPYSGIGDPHKVVQSKSTVDNLRTLFIILPVIMAIAGVLFALLYKLSPTNHKIVVQEINRLEEGGRKQDVDPQTKAVCEQLTGLPYEKLYGG